MATNRLRKRDRLVNRKHINILFQTGSYFQIDPFKVFYVKKKEQHY
ncbi:hypothetical protein [Candidatus Cardinium hertigii]|nr:hypothetical protein [Candidatus Cardinium hertigii]